MNEMNLKQIATAMQEADVRAVGPDAYLKTCMHLPYPAVYQGN